MNIKKLKVKLATHYHIEAIDGIYESSLQVKAKIESGLAQQAADISADQQIEDEEREYMLSSLGDELFIAEVTTELAGEMMVVALYKTIEIAIKKMTSACELFTKTQLASFYRITELKKQLKMKVVDIETLAHYKAYDELRCINNAIKHSGVVGADLAAYPGFKKGERLSDLHTHYYRLRSDVDRFLLSLQAEIIKAIP
jgi:hypothetical protein